MTAKSIVVITLAVAALIAFMTWAAVPKPRTMSGPIFQPTHPIVY